MQFCHLFIQHFSNKGEMAANKSSESDLIQWTVLLCFIGMALADATGRYAPEILVQGDIIRTNHRSAWKYSSRWTNGVVPYEIEQSLSDNHVKVIKEAMENYEKLTCIRFVPRTENHQDYVLFMDGGDGQCYSSLGRSGGRQNLSLGSGCDDFAIATHEIGHALGFDHEHVRPDRDQYVTILWDNVDPTFRFAYEKRSPNDVDLQGIRYDYLSILHYSGYYYNKVIETLDPSFQDKIGAARNLSRCDLEKINRWYNCVDKIQPDNPCADQTSSTTQKSTSTTAIKECKDDPRLPCHVVKENPTKCFKSTILGRRCKKSCNRC